MIIHGSSINFKITVLDGFFPEDAEKVETPDQFKLTLVNPESVFESTVTLSQDSYSEWDQSGVGILNP